MLKTVVLVVDKQISNICSVLTLDSGRTSTSISGYIFLVRLHLSFPHG